jgi:uncharacterized protein (TIGR03067 family)
MHLAILLAFVGGPAIAAPVEKAKDHEKIQGSWDVVELVINGEPAPDKLRKDMRFEFKDDAMVMRSSEGKREFRFKLDPSTKPRALDLTAVGGGFAGQSTPAIYQFDGDDLKLCLPSQTTRDRPTEFRSGRGSDLACVVLKRGKAEK